MINRPLTARPYTYEFWLERAEEARTRAEAMRDANAKQTMLTVAEMYEAMARRVKAKTREF